MKRKNTLDTATVTRTEKDLHILNDLSISEITSSLHITTHPVKICDITSGKKIHLHVRGFVYYFGGYAEHTRRVLFGLLEDPKFTVLL